MAFPDGAGVDGRDGREARMGAFRSAAAAVFVAIALSGVQVAMAVDRPPLPYDIELDNATYLLVRAPKRAARRYVQASGGRAETDD